LPLASVEAAKASRLESASPPGADPANLPAYEFSTGDPEVRVLAWKLKAKPNWLVTARAAGGADRQVKVNLPQLGELALLARGSGAVYHLRLVTEKPPITLLDKDGLLPTKAFPVL
jgi:hypothetical protein